MGKSRLETKVQGSTKKKRKKKEVHVGVNIDILYTGT